MKQAPNFNAIVTGATSGIGRAIALGLHAAGYHVLALGRDAGALADLRSAGLQAEALDVTDRAAVTARLGGSAPARQTARG